MIKQANKSFASTSLTKNTYRETNVSVKYSVNCINKTNASTS